MNNISVRRLIWEFLVDTEKSQGFINLEIETVHQKLPSKERGFATELIYGSVRQRLRLDWSLNKYIHREIDPELRELLRMATYEALFMRTPDHAIVFEYVEIAKKVLGSARSTMVNAVLRRIVENLDSLRNPDQIELSVETSHPEWIVNVFSQILQGSELREELLSHNASAKVQGVSFEPLDNEDASAEATLPFGYSFNKPPSQIASIKSQKSFVQDFGSQLLCEVMLATDPKRQYKWLDLCAGPGGKFTYLAHFLPIKQLYGIELHEHRSKLIRNRNPGYVIDTVDGQESSNISGSYQRILIDAPCTGLGALRRRPDARWRKSEKDLKGLLTLQKNLLSSGAKVLDHGGIIGYATCSPHLLETKVQILDFLRNNSEFSIMPIKTEWIDSHYHSAVTKEGFLQLMTSRHDTDGMFLALLQRGERR